MGKSHPDQKRTMRTGSERMLAHILGIAEVPRPLTLLVGRCGLCGSPFTHLLYTACLCVRTCV